MSQLEISNMHFTELNLAPQLLEALEACGYDVPTPIQAQTIPALLAGRDVIGSAQTGTGKTAAFVLPALQRLAAQPALPPRHRMVSAPRVLVLAPTRELAQQVAEQVVRYGQRLRVTSVCLYGGAPYPVQNRQLQRGADFLVATPGRLLDHIERGRVDLSRLEVLVLDEADRMLDMGFIDDVERICALTPATRQTVLFSATYAGAIGRLAAKLTRDPVRVDIRAEQAAPVAIEQRVHFVDDRSHKYRMLDHLLADVGMRQSIVFIATKRDAEALAVKLQGEGHAAAALHGDMNQYERNRTLNDLRRGGVRTLVATDVAARGIDVPGLTHVINFDLPRQAEDYVHRIGRTGRAGATGIAVSFANHAERGTIRTIERFTGATIPAHVIPGLEPRVRASAPAAQPRRPAYGKPAGGRSGAPAHSRGGRPGDFQRKYGRDR
ncbi:MAG: DEAD/DEAH box helicase [Burkholderiales bacterium]|nr:DEAD/DEAH box helicase [Burkholderiales bacterium]